jgi:hypothetical protein
MLIAVIRLQPERKEAVVNRIGISFSGENLLFDYQILIIRF